MTNINQADIERAAQWLTERATNKSYFKVLQEHRGYEWTAEDCAAYAQAERERQRSGEWISVSERLPELTQVVMTHDGEHLGIGYYNELPGEPGQGLMKYWHPDPDVTHWREIPPPPGAGPAPQKSVDMSRICIHLARPAECKICNHGFGAGAGTKEEK